MSLYVADLDNDGRDDFLLTARNPVSSHNDWAVGLWTPHGSGLERRAFEALEPFQPADITHFAQPFLRRDPVSVGESVRRRDTLDRWIIQSGHARLLDTQIDDENYLTKRKQRKMVKGAR